MDIDLTDASSQDQDDYGNDIASMMWRLLVTEKSNATELLAFTHKKRDARVYMQHIRKRETAMLGMLLLDRMIVVTNLASDKLTKDMQQIYDAVTQSPATKDVEDLTEAMSRLTIRDDGHFAAASAAQPAAPARPSLKRGASAMDTTPMNGACLTSTPMKRARVPWTQMKRARVQSCAP